MQRFGEAIEAVVTIAKLPSRQEQESREELVPAGDSVLPDLNIANLDAGSRVYFGVPAEIAGVIVVEVEPDSAAAQAAITEGDVILQIGREPVASLGQAVVAREKIVGDKILLRLLGWEGIKFALLDKG